ncbi:unnamed protein product [Urochloa humidicola]
MYLAAAAAVPGLTPPPRAARPRCARLVPRRGGAFPARAATGSASAASASTASSSSSSSSAAAAAPVYAPTPQDRPLRTPHSGYHYDGTTRPFFEGWYFKVSIPECRQSFCFMYSVENPQFRDGMSDLDKLVHGPRFTGVGAQILGADDKYICQFSEKSNNFWGSRHELMLGNTFIPNKDSTPPQGEVPPQEFSKHVLEGFQVTPIWHQGFIRDDGRLKYVPNVQTARWEYSTRPVYGWGDVESKQSSTAGWLAAFPFFEPHWQICMAGGLSTGWIEWDGERFEFENAPSYSEKNWGGGFPRKWYWIQCNVFSGASGEVSLTAAGGLRKIGLGDTYESPSLVEIEATTTEPGTALRAPTMEAGLVPACKDTCYGDLKLQLWEKKYDGGKGKMILDTTSNMAALEVGGGPWFNGWKGTTVVNEVVNNIVGTPIDVESLFPIPFLKPPGL